MTAPASRHDLDRFRAAIVAHVGLQFDDAKLGFLAEVLWRRVGKLGRSSQAYLHDLERRPADIEIGALARELTVGETYFFRHNDQFRALAEIVLPERMARHGTKALNLLSAGCSSGEEAYSMAIVVRETLAGAARDVAIRAVDLNPAALEKAARGRYSSWALRDTPPEIQRKWFRPDNREMVLDETVRAAVTFGSANLASDDRQLWQPAIYDAIFCRNVLMYFAPEQMRVVVDRIAQSLAPGGFLFLGHAETLRTVSDQFHLRHTHGTFYYQRRESADIPARRIEPIAPTSAPILAPLAVCDGAWVDMIRQATERITALVPASTAAAVPARAPPPPWDTAPALDLLRQERFGEALEHVRTGPSEADADPDVLLLEATLLAHSGQLTAAETACRQLLLIDELNAGAHYVLALCREHAGDRDGATEHDRVAAYLDPAFAMPRLHLGLLARRAGDRDAAGRELAQALVLLRSEDASRLLLFGGGFTRDALIALCQASLADRGGRP